MNIKITTFYGFFKIESAQLEEMKKVLKAFAQDHDVRGLVVLAPEGFNLTVSSNHDSIIKFKSLFFDVWGFKNILTKDSGADKHPFKKFRVAIRPEIVTTSTRPEVAQAYNNHLTPAEWDKKLKSGDAVVIDVRSWYETTLGKFKNAIDFNLKEYQQFPEALKNSDIKKDKEVLIYCTGGVKCEKAIEEMRAIGFEKVYQLEGGILNYLSAYPNSEFEGECFVYDHRVAVDQNLNPSEKYRLCPHCGQPGELTIECLRCDHPATICQKCAEVKHHHTCSKNCAHHYQARPGVKGPHQSESVFWSQAE